MKTLIHKADGSLVPAEEEEGPYRVGRRISLWGSRIGTILPSEGRQKIEDFQKWVLFDEDGSEVVVHHGNMTFIDKEKI